MSPDSCILRTDMSATAVRVTPLPHRLVPVTDASSEPPSEAPADPAHAAGPAWRGLQFPWLAVIARCAREDALASRALVNFGEPEASALRALAALLVPAAPDGGAHRVALAVHFVDRALDMRFFAEAWPRLRAGLADLDVRARVLGAAGFAALDASRQAAVLRQVERTPFVALLRDLFDTAVGGVASAAEPSAAGARSGFARWDRAHGGDGRRSVA